MATFRWSSAIDSGLASQSERLLKLSAEQHNDLAKPTHARLSKQSVIQMATLPFVAISYGKLPSSLAIDSCGQATSADEAVQVLQSAI